MLIYILKERANKLTIADLRTVILNCVSMGGVLSTTRIYTEIVTCIELWDVIAETLGSDLDERRGKKGRKKVDREKKGEGRREKRRGEEEEERREERRMEERRMEERRMEEGEGWKRKRREEREVCPIPTICRNTKQNCNG